MNLTVNKKVLLRERKRHTAHRIASTLSVVLVGEGDTHRRGGYPIPGQGVPHLGVLPVLTWPGGYPRVPPPPGKNMGPVEVLWDGDGVPSPRCGKQYLWKQYLPVILHTRAVTRQSRGKLQEAYCPWHNLSKHNLSWGIISCPGWGGGGTPSWPGCGGTPSWPGCGGTPSWPGWGYTSPGWGGGYPILTWLGGTPPPSQDWDWGTQWRWGTPLNRHTPVKI